MDVAKCYLIQFLNFFPYQVFSGLEPICNGGIQAGQPRLSTWYLNSMLTPGHIHYLVSGTRAKAELLNGLPNTSHHSKWSCSSSGWSSWHCQSLLHLHRFIWLPLSRLSLFSRRKIQVFKLQFHYTIFLMFQVDWMKTQVYRPHAVMGAFKCFRMVQSINRSTFALLTLPQLSDLWFSKPPVTPGQESHKWSLVCSQDGAILEPGCCQPSHWEKGGPSLKPWEGSGWVISPCKTF